MPYELKKRPNGKFGVWNKDKKIWKAKATTEKKAKAQIKLLNAIEHNPNFDIFPFLTSGRWHLVHHYNNKVNFGLFIPIWDIMFGSYKSHKVSS